MTNQQLDSILNFTDKMRALKSNNNSWAFQTGRYKNLFKKIMGFPSVYSLPN